MMPAFKRFISIPVRKLDPKARLPVPAHEGDVGFDLYALEASLYLPPWSTTKVHTGLALCDFPAAVEADGRVIGVAFPKIEARSGLASRGVFPVGGIIDPTYRGEIIVLLHNSCDHHHVVDCSRPVAQLVLYTTLSNMTDVHTVKFLEDDQVTPTERGEDGLGSTDTK